MEVVKTLGRLQAKSQEISKERVDKLAFCSLLTK